MYVDIKESTKNGGMSWSKELEQYLKFLLKRDGMKGFKGQDKGDI
jgi:hypothetical protein